MNKTVDRHARYAVFDADNNCSFRKMYEDDGEIYYDEIFSCKGSTQTKLDWYKECVERLQNAYPEMDFICDWCIIDSEDFYDTFGVR